MTNENISVSTNVAERLKVGIREGVTYPIVMKYCGHCTMPIEYCEYYPEYEKCKEWLERNMPDDFERLKIEEEQAAADGTDDDKKRQKRGGKGLLRVKKKEDVPKRICVSRAARGKKKSVTVVTGLSTFDIDLKVAAKFFGTKFACGSSVTGDDEIVIQGDVKDELFDVIPDKWSEIDEDAIEDLGDQKR
ncbi:GL22388 [Drosophila persimilis]|uniref:Density-regulated protein n=3 Tax=pseudoobscura subgroup TaxID=32358 RepID=Q29FL1_DROPS|nr:density-regulated protein homolog [Drosophila pseudoobscura]XP_002027720.1 density-regulated protein homolog [Drosophila persimilis]EDW36709.1 GL22388 [Drosophila persimilis]DBA35831.1 TPA: Density regulated protein [Drosophila pseudoobscura]DBA35832.1 TPA: Density regulated protein [Drosophila pseudoobscura]